VATDSLTPFASGYREIDLPAATSGAHEAIDLWLTMFRRRLSEFAWLLDKPIGKTCSSIPRLSVVYHASNLTFARRRKDLHLQSTDLVDNLVDNPPSTNPRLRQTVPP
jgi:hypothetical protein